MVTGTTEYDPYGNRTNHTGTEDSAIGYSGNWVDSTTGFIYLRARDYDPTTGQFLTVDPDVDTTREPYAYAANDPLDNSDPTGLNCRLHSTSTPSDFESQLAWQELGPEYVKDISGFSSGLNLDALFDPSNSVDQKYRNDPGFQVEQGIGEVVSLASIVTAVKDIAMSVADSPAENSSPAAKVASRASELQESVPANSQGRITMATGAGTDPGGNWRVVVGTSEKGGYLRPGVSLMPGEELATGPGHAEASILDYMKANGISPATIGAGRPICALCAGQIDDSGASPASPLKVQVH